jgi:predicted RNA-binding Zn ribbon-like protein
VTPVLVGTLRPVPYHQIDLVHPALDLVNSQHGRGPDLLEVPSWFARFLGRWGYGPAGPPTERERGRLRGLRRVMRRIVEALDEGKSPSADDLAELNRVLAGARLTREATHEEGAFGLRLHPARRDWAWVLAELAASLVELLSRSELERIKVCDNPDCRFAFYDSSRNRSRRWCAHSTCGNRHKVRQFRARRRAAEAGRPS